MIARLRVVCVYGWAHTISAKYLNIVFCPLRRRRLRLRQHRPSYAMYKNAIRLLRLVDSVSYRVAYDKT